MNFIRASIRFPVFVFSTLLIYYSWRVLAFVVPNKVLWRQVTFHNWCRIFAFIAQMKIEVIGTPPKPPFLLVCNHLSYVDIPALRLAANGIFIAKSDIKDWFVAGPIIRNMGNIFIDRTNRRDIPRAGAEVMRKLSEQEGVIFFPEGTSTKGEDVLPFNSSFLEFAAKIDLPVSYASIRYATPAGEPTPSERICWWDDTGFIMHMWRLFSLKRFTAIISFGEEPVSDPNRKELARHLHEKVKERFIPML